MNHLKTIGSQGESNIVFTRKL